MSRTRCWLFVCFVFAVNWAFAGFPRPELTLLVMALLGAPSLVHYGTNERKRP